MIKKSLLTVLLASLVGVATASEQEGQWYLNPTVGYSFLDSDRNLDDSGLFGLGLEYLYNTSWGTELKYLQGSMDTDTSGANDADMKHIVLEGMYYLTGSNKKFAPYLAAGLGHGEYDYDITGKSDGTSALIGPGFRYALSERLSSKVDLRLVHGVDEGENDGLLTLALSYALGKTKKAKASVSKAVMGDADQDGINDNNDQCPNTPVGVSVDSNGCELDSDGDGVVDSSDQCPNTAVGAKVDTRGCAEKLSRTETIALNVTFATSSAELTNNFMEEIEKVARFMRQYTSVTGVIEGHTDDRGRADFNQALSQRRAETVRAVLIDQFGIDAQRLTATGLGESQPVASNDTAQGRQANRRVAAVFEAQVTE